MAVKIRLRRLGHKKAPFYRIVNASKRLELMTQLRILVSTM